MNNIIARVVAQSQPVNVATKSGDMAKCTVRLKEIGGEFADEFQGVILGPLATIDLAEGQLVGVGKHPIPHTREQRKHLSGCYHPRHCKTIKHQNDYDTQTLFSYRRRTLEPS